MHTSKYDENVDLTGLRVGVIGTGASAVQVIPAVAKVAKELFVLQRTPCYCWARNEKPITESLKSKILTQGEPLIQDLRYNFNHFWEDTMLPNVWNNPEGNFAESQRIRKTLRKIVHDPETAAALSPYYSIGCKRVTVTDDYWPTFNRDNVTLVSDPKGVVEVNTTGVVMHGGERVENLDVLIFATGFDAANGYFSSVEVVGKEGKTLTEAYEDGPQTLYGMLSHGFPNLFVMCGPQGKIHYTSGCLKGHVGFNAHINTTEIIDVQSGKCSFGLSRFDLE